MQLSNGGQAVVAGVVCKDFDYGLVGQAQVARCKFSVYLGKGEDGKGRYANCVAWRELAEYASTMRDGDRVLVAGVIREHEHEGKIYKTLNADFVMIQRGGGYKETDEELPF